MRIEAFVGKLEMYRKSQLLTPGFLGMNAIGLVGYTLSERIFRPMNSKRGPMMWIFSGVTAIAFLETRRFFLTHQWADAGVALGLSRTDAEEIDRAEAMSIGHNQRWRRAILEAGALAQGNKNSMLKWECKSPAWDGRVFTPKEETFFVIGGGFQFTEIGA
jgi:hypothetical protein